MNFFRLFYALCYSPGAVIDLYRNGAFKAWLHTLLAAFFCALFSTMLFCITNYSKAAECVSRFDAEFGGIVRTDNEILPVKEPEKSRFVKIAPDLALSYLPYGEQPGDLASDYPTGILWTPQAMFYWEKTDSEHAIINHLDFTDMEFVQHLLKQPVLNSTLRVLAQDAAVEAEKNVQNTKLTLSFTDSKFPVFAGLAIGFLFAAFLHYLVVATVICGIFFLISRLFKGRGSALTAGQYWSVLLYSGFPSMFLGAVINGLGLDISFHMVYIVGLVIYLFIAIAKLDQFLKGSGNK